MVSKLCHVEVKLIVKIRAIKYFRTAGNAGIVFVNVTALNATVNLTRFRTRSRDWPFDV